MAIAVFLIAYGLGSIPFGLVLTHAAGLGDIRSIGSGNIGATNVLRTGNKKLAAATLMLDGLKGAAAVVAARYWAPDFEVVAAVAALLGHLFPIWLRFKGGKGVATGLGVMTALVWPAGISMMLIWAAVAKSFKISSLAALAAFAVAPIVVMVVGRTDLVPVALIISGLIFYRHRENISRLIKHTEPKIGLRS